MRALCDKKVMRHSRAAAGQGWWDAGLTFWLLHYYLLLPLLCPAIALNVGSPSAKLAGVGGFLGWEQATMSPLEQRTASSVHVMIGYEHR